MNESLDQFLARCKSIGADPDKIEKSVNLHPLAGLERRWYNSLDVGLPDYRIYGEEEYLADVWVCWKTYSSRYLKLIEKLGLAPRTVLDVGCGLGYSSATLKEIFPAAQVFATNIANTPQWAFAQELADQCMFHLVREVSDLSGDLDIDLVFASEYFEHFIEPVRELDRVLKVRPDRLVIANTFSQRSLGHFDAYQFGDLWCSGSTASRRFNDALRLRGFMRVKTGWWNNRPDYWTKMS